MTHICATFFSHYQFELKNLYIKMKTTTHLPNEFILRNLCYGNYTNLWNRDQQNRINFTYTSNLTSRNCPDKSHCLPRPKFLLSYWISIAVPSSYVWIHRQRCIFHDNLSWQRMTIGITVHHWYPISTFHAYWLLIQIETTM